MSEFPSADHPVPVVGPSVITFPRECVSHAAGHHVPPYYSYSLTRPGPKPLCAWGEIVETSDDGWFTIRAAGRVMRRWTHDIDQLRRLVGPSLGSVTVLHANRYLRARDKLLSFALEASSCEGDNRLSTSALALKHCDADAGLTVTAAGECHRQNSGHFLNLTWWRHHKDDPGMAVEVFRVLPAEVRGQGVAAIQLAHRGAGSGMWLLHHRLAEAQRLQLGVPYRWIDHADILRPAPGHDGPHLSVLQADHLDDFRRCR